MYYSTERKNNLTESALLLAKLALHNNPKLSKTLMFHSTTVTNRVKSQLELEQNNCVPFEDELKRKFKSNQDRENNERDMISAVYGISKELLIKYGDLKYQEMKEDSKRTI